MALSAALKTKQRERERERERKRERKRERERERVKCHQSMHSIISLVILSIDSQFGCLVYSFGIGIEQNRTDV